MVTIAEVMSRDLLAVERSLSLTDAARAMHERRVGAVVVLDDGRLVGILTERDVLRAVAKGIQDDTEVSEWMTRDPETMEPDEPTLHAAVLMIHGGFRHLPLMDGEEVVGMLSIRDLMRIVLDDAAPRGV